MQAILLKKVVDAKVPFAGDSPGGNSASIHEDAKAWDGMYDHGELIASAQLTHNTIMEVATMDTIAQQPVCVNDMCNHGELLTLAQHTHHHHREGTSLDISFAVAVPSRC